MESLTLIMVIVLPACILMLVFIAILWLFGRIIIRTSKLIKGKSGGKISTQRYSGKTSFNLTDKDIEDAFSRAMKKINSQHKGVKIETKTCV